MVNINPDYRLNFPATTRNRDSIAAVLSNYISPNCWLLEIASGSGQHGVFFQKNSHQLLGKLVIPNLNIDKVLIHGLGMRGFIQKCLNLLILM